MARTIEGVLKLPDGGVMAGARVIFRALETGDVLQGVESTFTADASGAYSWSVQNGRYAVWLQYGGRQWSPGAVTVADGEPIDLDDLLMES